MEHSRTRDRLEDVDAVQDFLRSYRVGPVSIDRRRKAFEFGCERIEPRVIDNFGHWRGMPTAGWFVRDRREAEPDVSPGELDATLAAVDREAVETAVTSEQKRLADIPFARPNATLVVSSRWGITRRRLVQ